MELLLISSYKIQSNILLSRLTPYAGKLLAIMNVGFVITGQLLIIYSAFVKYLIKKKENTMSYL
jgi:hypothetical protein